MKTGDIVTIHEDPFTRKRVEGEARLERRVGTKNGVVGDKAVTAERWEVRFREEPYVRHGLDGDPREWEPETFERLIVPKETT